MENEKYSGKLKSIIESGAEITGGIANVAIGLLIPESVSGIAGAFLAPVISTVFRKVGNEISAKVMAHREQARIGATISIALEKINEKYDNGEVIRDDDFFSVQGNYRSKSESILEGTLLKVRNEYEEKKIQFYSSLLSNISFNTAVTFEKGNVLLKMLEQLSYRQIIILSYFSDIDSLNIYRWEISFKDKIILSDFHDFYFELMDLYDKQLLKQVGQGIALSVNSLGISPLGKMMIYLISANETSEDEKTNIKNIINSIQEIVET